MDNIIYALVESDRCEDFGSFFVKINRNDKKAFEELAEATTDQDWEWGTIIRAWVKDVCLAENEWYENMEIVAIEEYMSRIRIGRVFNYNFTKVNSI